MPKKQINFRQMRNFVYTLLKFIYVRSVECS